MERPLLIGIAGGTGSGKSTVARKIAATVRALGLARFQLKYSAGPLPHARLMNCIELYATKVVPLVRDMLACCAPTEASARRINNPETIRLLDLSR